MRETQEENFEDREEHDYWTIRGNETDSCLLGARTAVAEGIELLFWLRKPEGLYGKGKRHKAYTRTLICKISLKNSVGYMGKEIRVAVCHLHQQVANKNTGFRQNNDSYKPFLADRLREHHVQVLMGDFNMSLFKVVPELRNNGLRVQLVAWYPWRLKADSWRNTGSNDNLMADSCGIFFCVPCTVTLAEPNVFTSTLHLH